MNEFVVPEFNYFGSGSLGVLEKIVEKHKLKKGLIITDKNLSNLGFVDKVMNILTNINTEIDCFDEVHPNPMREDVNKALLKLQSDKYDFIIGLGGGSANDCAKAVSILSVNDKDISELEGANKSKKRGKFLITINTTAGTASEISRAYLIEDDMQNRKIIMKDDNVLPRATINDTDLMLSLPPLITASTGMDALTHAIESYVSKSSYQLTKEFAISAIYLIFNNLEAAVKNGENKRVRENMIYAQTLAGMAFCNSGVGLVHAMAHQLGSLYNIHHGLANAVLLPSVMEENKIYVSKEYSNIYQRVFGKDKGAEELIYKVEELSKRIGTHIRLEKLGVKITDIEKLSQMTLKDPNINKNPFFPNVEIVKKIFMRVY